MRQFVPSLFFLSICGQIQAEEESKPGSDVSIILNALSIYEEPHSRQKRQCGGGGCGGGCRGYGYGCGGGCRGGGCGGGFRGGGYGCGNPCGRGGRLCCDNVAPRPCVGCGLNRGIFPEPVPVSVGFGSVTCCSCCMAVQCAPRCVNFGGCNSCGGIDYFDYGFG